MPYFGAVRKGDLASERKAVGRYLRWKAEQEGTPWEKHEGNTPYGDAVMVGMTYIGERDRGKKHGQTTSESAIQEIVDRRVARLSSKYAEKYREFIRDLILTDPRRAAVELEIDQLAWLNDLKPPPPTLLLSDVTKCHFESGDDLSEDWLDKMRRFWDKFVHIVGVEAVHELDREKIHRYRIAVSERAAKGKSPTYKAHRFGCVKTILRHAKEELEHPELAKVLRLCCKVLKKPKKHGVNPKPIPVEAFRRLLEAVDDDPKWNAMFLLALNA